MTGSEGKRRRVLTKASAVILASVIFAAGCAVKFISDYDYITDATLTEIQKKFEVHFNKLENAVAKDLSSGNNESAYSNYEDIYAEIKADIRVLLARNKLRKQNDLTVEQMVNLYEATEKAEQIHKMTEGTPPEKLTLEDIKLMRSGIDSSIVAILKLELAKKRDLK